MRQLHLVGFTTDRRGLIFSVRRGAKSGGFIVDVGDELLTAIDEARERMAEDAAEADAAASPHVDRADRPQSSLAVREIQARLRQGQSIDAVAAKAGVDVEWIARFAAPVFTEMAEIVRTVRARRYSKQRVGTSGAPLGESVYRNLVERGVSTPRDDLDRGWSARQLADGQWEVRFDYVSRGRPVSVAWSYDEVTGKIVGRDRLATQLAFRTGGPPASKRAKAAGAPAGAAAVAEAAAEDPPRPAATKAAAKKMAAARRAARARMVAEAERATRRNAAVARKAAKRKPTASKPRSSPSPDLDADLDSDVDVERDIDVDVERDIDGEVETELELDVVVAEVDVDEGELDEIDSSNDGEEVDEVDAIDDVDDEEAVPARPRRPSVPRHQALPTPTAALFDTADDDLPADDDVALDLAWLEEAEPPAAAAPEPGSGDGDVAAMPPTPRPRRREPLRAARTENGAVDTNPRVLVRRAPSGPPPVFRADMVTPAGGDSTAPPRPSRRAPRPGS